MNKSEQPVAIVTGASSGIGLRITQALLERGWSVVGTSSSDQQVKDLQHIPTSSWWTAKREEEKMAIPNLWKRLSSASAGIDLLVNNAGISISKPFTGSPRMAYNRVMNTNVASMFFISQLVIPEIEAATLRARGEYLGHSRGPACMARSRLLAILSKSPFPR